MGTEGHPVSSMNSVSVSRTHSCDGHNAVRHAAAVRVIHVPEQGRVFLLREQPHSPVAVRGFELVFLRPHDLVDFVDEQHRAFSSFSGPSSSTSLHRLTDRKSVVRPRKGPKVPSTPTDPLRGCDRPKRR